MRATEWSRRVAVGGGLATAGLALVSAVAAGTANAQGGSDTTNSDTTNNAVVVGNAASGSASAPAPGTTGPAPITIPASEVAQWCQTQVPELKAEATQLINWINAGPSTVGSTQWLLAQAQQARANGHPAIADVLTGREERRTGVLTVLEDVQTKLTEFTNAHCGYLGSGR